MSSDTPLAPDAIRNAIHAVLVPLGLDGVPESPEGVHLEKPAIADHGDFSTNTALALGKRNGRNPRDLATELAEALRSAGIPHVADVEIAGPGFVNFRLEPSWLQELLPVVVAAGPDYGRSSLGDGRRVLVEFVSANPTGPVHAGHARGATYGDALARLLGFAGFDVGREFYINDRGVQMLTFATSLEARAAGQEPPEGGYLGQYVADWAQLMPAGADPLEWGYAHALGDQRRVLELLNVHFDHWFSERDMVASGAIEQTLADLRERGVVDDRDGAVWLRSTDFGDDKDRVLVKSDGEFTYLLPDIAYHRDKYSRGWDVLVDVLGADHHGYVARMKAAAEALGHPPDDLEMVITQLVRLERDGEEVKISKRSGDLVTLEELIDEIGPDAVRLTYLLQSIDSPQTVDLDLAIAESNENPVFYVQMANARLNSIGRVAAERGVERLPLADADISLLVHERELAVLRALQELPATVELAARERAPHKVTTWVRDLAASVHGFYHDCPILSPDTPDDLRQARLWLAESARIGLRVGLDLLGVDAPESM
ncbi:MAG: arginine--tRNA ligase [Actinomycetia bacterium]|nr:arginine--tRNA ligase [Actinomycetes bacterium]